MKELETIKEYVDKLLGIANKNRSVGSKFSNSWMVQKLLVTILSKFNATISSLENTKDLSKVTLIEIVNALQAQEQRKMMRDKGCVKGAL